MNCSSSGLNFSKLDFVGQNVIEYAEKINNILNDITEINDKLFNALSYDDVSKIKSKYDSIKVNYSVIVNNILSYNDDFAKIKKKVNISQEDLFININNEINKVDTNFSIK